MITLPEVAALQAVAEVSARETRQRVRVLLRQVAGGPDAWVAFEAAEREQTILHKLQLELIANGKTTSLPL